MAGSHEEEPGFWPGYVAAVSGLVQGLLIMAMALGISIFALGQLASEVARQGNPLRARHPDSGFRPAALPPTYEGNAQADGPGGTAAGPGAAGTVARGAGRPPAAAGPDGAGGPESEALAVRFLGDAVALPASSADAARRSIAAAIQAGAVRWRVEAHADRADPRSERAAYLRVLTVRKLLADNGVEPSAIDLWIGDALGDAQGQIAIVPLGAGGANASGARKNP